MSPESSLYKKYLAILNEELVPATGCTEPIAVAYAAARAREELGAMPERVLIEVSGNIIKNVKSVVVPNTGGMKGLKAAAAAGIVAGDSSKKLEVIADVSDEDRKYIADYLSQCPFEVRPASSSIIFDIVITLFGGGHYVKVRIANSHTNIVLIQKDGQTLLDKPVDEDSTSAATGDDINLETILDFANTARIEDVKELLDKQIICNSAIAEEGLKGDWGANIGSVLLSDYGNDIKTRARAYAAAGSDARMAGCEMPVVITSGSGNQGLTCSMPVVQYAKELGVSQETLYRALLVSVLTTVYQKMGIGKLSAYCGAVSAGVGAGAGIAYLYGGGYDAIAHTVINGLGMASGIVCDGAKPSCACKIATAVGAGILGYQMYTRGDNLCGGDGILGETVDKTVANIGRLASEGMRETDKTIIKIMCEN